MKVLHFAGYVTIDDDKEFSKNASGYGYMVMEICKSFESKQIEIFILTQSNITNGKVHKNIKLLRRRWIDIFININLRDVLKGIYYLFSKKTELKKIPNIILYHISLGYFRKVIKNHDFDLIHFHGIGDYTCPMIDECYKNNFKFLVTLHGINFLRHDLRSTDKKLEKNYLKRFHEKNTPVTVISSGIRKRILEYLKTEDSKTFFVINNAFNHKGDIHKINIREQFNIDNDKKIMLCIGNISERKNQEQILRSFALLSDSIQKKLCILFIGSDLTNGAFNKKVANLKSKNIIVCGKVNKKLMSSFYNSADFNILASIDEGFGLSIIESLYFGIPSIIFKDIDIYDDVFDSKSIIAVENRTDTDLANGIEAMFLNDWHKNEIQINFEKFDSEIMANNYFNQYKTIHDNR